MRAILQNWRSNSSNHETESDAVDKSDDSHVDAVADNLESMLSDSRIPESVRVELSADYEYLNAMQQKIRQGDLHVCVFGKVSAGKSSLLNALLGKHEFSVSPLHGETRTSRIEHWQDSVIGGVHLIDTPGINEMNGEEREKLAYDVASRCDLLLFVTDSDLTRTEMEALTQVREAHRPVLVALNKKDRYTEAELDSLLGSIRAQCEPLIPAENIVAVAADPAPVSVVTIDDKGRQHGVHTQTTSRYRCIDRSHMAHTGRPRARTIAALNAAIFAGRLSDQVAERMVAARREIAERVTRSYSLYKGLAVAVNPVPVADLLAAATVDVALVIRLSEVYGLSLSKSEGSKLLLTIAGQMIALMGAVWGVHLASSVLKGMTAGLSVTVTGLAQGALAYYATYLVGRSAEEYLINGKSWGEDGPQENRQGHRQFTRQGFDPEQCTR